MAIPSDPDFDRLQKDYQATISKKLSDLSDLIEAVRKAPSLETLTALRFIVHKLAGNAGVFGYIEVSQMCKQFEWYLVQQLQAPLKLDPKLLEECDRYFQKIKQLYTL